MGKTVVTCIVLLVSVLPLHAESPLEGIWEGTLTVPGGELRVVFRISATEDGVLAATMDSPDQGATGIPVDEVLVEGAKVHIEVKSVLGAFDGEMAQDGRSIDGEWKQSGYTLPLLLLAVEEVREISRPQEPKEPYPYDEEEVIYENEKAGVRLAGTLTLPRSKVAVPAVLLISGSGAQDRNETVFGHRPFLVLADYLTRRELAVLRVDDRGTGESTGDFALCTSEDFASDVIAGIEYLKGRKEIDSGKIGLIGHSEGGLIAPMVAARTPDVVFIVLLAGTGVTGEEILYEQAALIARASGATEEAISENRVVQEAIFSVLKEESDDEMAETRIRDILAAAFTEWTEEEQQAMGYVEAGVEQQLAQVMSPWFRHFLVYDPAPTLREVKCPVLALIGEKDLQVPPGTNLPAIESALRDGGNRDFTVREIPSLNHLFQTATTGSILEYSRIEETIAPVALELIGDWILQRAGEASE